jgi:hypothetical protein
MRASDGTSGDDDGRAPGHQKRRPPLPAATRPTVGVHEIAKSGCCLLSGTTSSHNPRELQICTQPSEVPAYATSPSGAKATHLNHTVCTRQE